MPAPAKVDRAGIVAACVALVEAHGPAGVTLGALAEALGIKAPSLYKHFRDRAALLSAARAEGFRALAVSLGRSRDMRALSTAYRRFARRRPELYALLFAPGLPEDPDELAARRAGAEPLFALLRAHLVGADEATVLRAARVITAFVHGYVSMEIAGAFRLGPDPEAAYREGIDALWRALVPAEA